ncbi:hypothetical protein SBDP1_200017 [Syntrophobacter sp. SbD1]|nr:hypothetical protein SBDP1_200017 [Syntrophobacter sp. SbD1]
MSKNEVPPDSRRVTIWLSEDLISRADKLAERAEIDRGRLLRNIIEVGVDGLEKTGKVGILQISLLLRDMGDAIGQWVESIKRDGLKKFWS